MCLPEAVSGLPGGYCTLECVSDDECPMGSVCTPIDGGSICLVSCDPSQPDHTFYFHLETGGVIDAAVDGNRARWINHACTPNCEAREKKGRVFIHALTDIYPGEELFYDYRLSIDERLTPALKKRFECRCGADTCRGTLLLTKRAAAAGPSRKSQNR